MAIPTLTLAALACLAAVLVPNYPAISKGSLDCLRTQGSQIGTPQTPAINSLADAINTPAGDAH